MASVNKVFPGSCVCMGERAHCFIPGLYPDKQQIATQTSKVRQAESYAKLFPSWKSSIWKARCPNFKRDGLNV